MSKVDTQSVRFNGRTFKLQLGGNVYRNIQEDVEGGYVYLRFTIHRPSNPDIPITIRTVRGDSVDGEHKRVTRTGTWNTTNMDWDWA